MKRPALASAAISLIMGKSSLVRLVPTAVSQKMTYSVRLALSKSNKTRKQSLCDEENTNSSSCSSSPSPSLSSSPTTTTMDSADHSVKFGRKVQYVNYLHELQQHMGLEQLPIPKQVAE